MIFSYVSVLIKKYIYIYSLRWEEHAPPPDLFDDEATFDPENPKEP